MKDNTLQYYQENAKTFSENTLNADMDAVYNRFKHYVPDGYILDLGCGSGRDSKYFLENGYQVNAIDGSAALCEIAGKMLGQRVECKLFQDIEYREEFDAVWACASLLHVPKDEMADVFDRILCALKPQGVFYVSYKYGVEERIKDGRLFSDYTEKDIPMLFLNNRWEVLEHWISEDVRPDKSEIWLNIVAIKRL